MTCRQTYVFSMPTDEMERHTFRTQDVMDHPDRYGTDAAIKACLEMSWVRQRQSQLSK